MASFKFSSLYLFIILLIVLVISVLLGYSMNTNVVEGLVPSSSMSTPSSTSSLVPVTFGPYTSKTLYPIYAGTTNNLMMLLDTATGNMIVTNSIPPTSNFIIVDRYGESTEFSATSAITPTIQNLDPNANIGWTYENQQVSVSNITVNGYTYLYVFDHSVSPATINIFRSYGSLIVQDLPPSPVTLQYATPLTVNDSSPQVLETALEKMSNSDLNVSVGNSSLCFTNNYFVIVSIPPNSSNKTFVLINKNTYVLVLVNRTSPSSNGSGLGMTPSGLGMTPSGSVMPGNLGSIDTLIFALADIAGTYGKNMRGQGQGQGQGQGPGPSSYQQLSGFEQNNTGLGCGINPANSNYILKSEIVPPVCPQCPSCGMNGCPLSVNSTGQIVDCNGNVISNFGATPSTQTTPSSSPGAAPSSGSISGDISSSINNAVSTTGQVADTALTAASNIAGTAGSTISNVAGTAGQAASNVAGSAGQAASNVAGTAGSTVGGLGKDLTNIVGGLGQDATTLGAAAIGATSGVANNAINSATSLAGGLGATTPTAATTPYGNYGYPPYGYYGYPSYGVAQQPYGNYPYMGYGGYQGPSTCSQQSTYLPITNDFSAFGR